jgi:putative phage-type endonuclease
MTAKLLCQAGDPEWLELRRTGITASDLPVILGLVSWDSPWALYHRKRGTLPEVEQSDRMRLGSVLEGWIAREWHDSAAYPGDLIDPGLYQNTDRPWQMATPDRLVTAYDDPDKITAVLECKTSATRDGWGETGSADVPAYVRAQVLWQMDTLGVDIGHVAVCFLPSGEFRSYTITHDDIGPPICPQCRDVDLMREKGLDFYQRITGELPAPPVDALTVTTKALQAVYAGLDDTQTAELNADLVWTWDTVREAYRDAETRKRYADNQIREALGTAATGTLDGKPVLRRQIGKRAGYEVPPGITDKLVKIKDKGDKSPDEQVRDSLRDLRDER